MHVVIYSTLLWVRIESELSQNYIFAESGVNNYIETKNDIYFELKKEFENENWPGYEIDSLDLSIKFISPNMKKDIFAEAKTVFK